MPHQVADSLDLDLALDQHSETHSETHSSEHDTLISSSHEDLSHAKEQSHGLLGVNNQLARDVEHLPDYEPSRRTPYYALRWTALVTAALALAGLVGWQLLASPGTVERTQDGGAAETPLVQPHRGEYSPSKAGVMPDYTIAADWDYDAVPTTRSFVWTITDVELNPDGVWRQMVVINGQFPGPMIEVNEGDAIEVTVVNNAVNATSFHWHGLYQNGTNWMDGTVGVTQCPIAPGSTFTYVFKAEKQYGTYWYHSHQSAQASDGLYGPLVIHSKEELALQELEYDTDRVVMLSDHYHDTSSALLMTYLQPDMENAEPVPDGGLINGRAVRNCTNFSYRNCSTESLAHPWFDLEPDRNHRLRIINTGAFAEFQFSVDEHSFAVTEVDGTVTSPAYFERLNINPAQRYSVVLSANSTARESFWMRAKMLSTCFTDPPEYIETDTLGVMTYSYDLATSGPPIPESKDFSEGPDLECRDLDTTLLHPVPVIPAPIHADATFFLRSNFEIGAYALSRGFFNQSSFRANVQSPTLHRAVDGLGERNRSWFPDGIRPGETSHAWVNDAAFHKDTELVVQTTGIQVVDLVVSNFDDGSHPLHLHGYKFFVLAEGKGYPPASLSTPGEEHTAERVDHSLKNPLRRDTASVNAFGWIWLRVVADNPGIWALHCHISWHSEAGLLMQLLTRADGLRDTNIPQTHLDLCAADVSELRKGMGPEDKVFYWKD